ncbi:MAG: flagellin, partial [Spirochaetota bacterium]
AQLGAKQTRLEMVRSRIMQDKANMEDILSGSEDTDITQAVTELKTMEMLHRAALGVTARIIQPTLLDFLR